MQNIAVGKPYGGSIRTEGGKFEYNRGFSLNIFLKDLSSDEIIDIKKGKSQFGITLLEGILFFTYSFGAAIEISDAPFHFGLYGDERIKDVPIEIEDGKGVALNIMAVDARTGIVKALRLIGLSTEVSRKLIEICHNQCKVEISRGQFDKYLNSVQSFYTSQELYEMAILKC